MRRDERGSQLVEFAIVVFLLVLILAGMADIGRAFNSYMIITNAAREGARATSRLSCYPTDATQRAVYKARIEKAVRDEVTGSAVPPGALTIVISPDPNTTCAQGGAEVRVTVSYPYTTILSGVTGIGNFTMRSSTAISRAGKF
jgi:Flp pilus assembly protein TadG